MAAVFILLLGVVAWSRTQTTRAERELERTVALLDQIKALNEGQNQHLLALTEQIRQLGVEPVVTPAPSPAPSPRSVVRRSSPRPSPVTSPVPGPSGPPGPPGPPGPNPSPRPTPTCVGVVCVP